MFMKSFFPNVNSSITKALDTLTTRVAASDDSIYRKYHYIVFDIDISYRIVSSGHIKFFDIS